MEKYMTLSDRMKRYEAVTQSYLMRKSPVIIRLDGKAFHTFTKGLDKPFDGRLQNTMKRTLQEVCSSVQGCVFGYMQSDEISLLLKDWESVETDCWYGYNVQKLVSVSSSIATAHFNIAWNHYYGINHALGLFDSRVFNLSKEEVVNYFIWRQQDCMRNSVQGMGQAHFSHRELHGKSVEEVKGMLNDIGKGWNGLSDEYKSGVVWKGGKLESGIVFKECRNYIEDML